VSLRLVGTLHEILLTVSDDADWIEADNLHQGIAKVEVL
jgi:hypothetical protein